MSISRQGDRRANQKARTRAALVEAGKRLLERGSPPTVAEAADEARVSRATAYRYFPTQEALLLEVANLNPAVAPVETLLEELPEADPEARLLALLDTCNPIMLEHQVAMRTALRGYQDTWLAHRGKSRRDPVVREGRRTRWLDTALAPLRRELGPERWRRLRAALSLTLGGDAMVVMKDVCQLADDEALAVLRWTARSLLRSALAEARETRPKPASGKRRGD